MDSKILKALGIDPALIFIFLLILIVILFVLYVNVTMKYNRLKSSYTTFMRGKDGKTLEESMMSGFSDVEAILKYTKQNRTDIQKLNKKMEKSYQKLGIVKYDAFNEMGGKLSFALAMLDNNNTGWIINAMHSREGCYTYVKEIVKGESYVELAEEEAEVSISQNIDLEKEIENVVFNDPATIVFWKDGTKTVTKCHAGDTFNKETGLAMCIIRKLCNNKHFNNVFEKYCN